MLSKNVINEKTYILLKTLMNDEKLKDFFLVGGTALALQLNHRISEDLDLFTRNDIGEDFYDYVVKQYNFDLRYNTKNTYCGYVENVKIDFIKYDYKILNDFIEEDGIRILSLPDIIPMKLQAILGNGTRIKDFIDVAYLSNFYSVNEMLKFSKEKFNIDNDINILRGLVYFDDINKDEKVIVFDENYSFENVKKHLIKMVENPDKAISFGVMSS